MQDDSFDQDVVNLIASCRSLLALEAMSGVDHYLNHGEPEMAFEGLLIELMKANRLPESFHSIHWEQMARSAGLIDEGGVFDYEIWNKFSVWYADR
ncbi:hypothetical protein Pan241w_30840 [Gimesia alba]|uniref:Uncharacterized protein n=1 Tax=Gimesia alba TaxID=2527973 RepID=A0A517RGJ0_9PLAN|nr:hypothetical protein [Gimesia alba]QDT42989.1 hypothetical protein Pan241w_30840 [Gimesia alba]